MLDTLWTWFNENETLLLWLGALSVLAFIVTLATLPYLVTRIPPDYFHRRHPFLAHWAGSRPVLRWVLFTVKNLVGVIVLFCGIAMLVLPGQGLITIFIGLMLMNFPGKFAFERWLVSRRGVLRAINWMRVRSQHPPLTLSD